MTTKKISEFPNEINSTPITALDMRNQDGTTLRNEINPNPVTALDIRTKDGTTLRFAFDPPIQQSKMVAALGVLHALLDVEVNIRLPEEA